MLMKTMLAVMFLALVVEGAALSQTVNFDNDKTGSPPSGWACTQTGRGEAKWAVVSDETAPSKPNVLKQSGVATFPVCLKDGASLKDGFVEVKFKPVAGNEDQAGGLIWRARDSNNYYVFRANANEDNAVLYKTVNGKRSSLSIVGRAGGYGVKERVASGRWHTLRVEFAGNKFKAFLDGKHVFDVEDSTFAEAGKVGVWTKADSVTLFDDFSYGAK
jgi:3-keto-disaccharide hydrolase